MAILDSTVDFWKQINNDDYYTDLVMAIEFSDRDRVSLFIAVCDVDRGLLYKYQNTPIDG